jgi:histidyl-tRNA synthetase
MQCLDGGCGARYSDARTFSIRLIGEYEMSATETKSLVPPELPGGFRDYLPPEVIARQRMINTIRTVFERFGFDPLETPGMELLDTLTGGEDTSMVLWNAQQSNWKSSRHVKDEDRRNTSLRFDLTVPLSRVIAAYRSEIKMPFKRYQVGNVWRGEKPQLGRFCEFMQFDADVVGSSSSYADAEIVALMVSTMRELGIERFVVRFNSRKVLNALPTFAGFEPECVNDVLRVVDKLPKIGRAGVMRELTKPTRDEWRPLQEEAERNGEPKRTVPDSHPDDPDGLEAPFGLGLSVEIVFRIGTFLDLAGEKDELIDATEALLGGIPEADAGIAELRTIVSALRAMGVPEQYWDVDLSIARGLAYYTGPVFETFLLDKESIGSVFSGGRYDSLVNRFMEGSFPATGASVGVDRLYTALVALGEITTTPTMTEVLVTVMDPECMDDYLALAGELRDEGVRTMLWLGEEKSFKAQLSYAAAQEIPIVVILGENERKKNEVAVKNMAERSQNFVPRARFVAFVQQQLVARP